MGPPHIAGTDHEYTDLLGITHLGRVKGLASAGNPIRWLMFFDQIVLNLGNMPVILLILEVPSRCFVQDDCDPFVQLQGRTRTHRGDGAFDHILHRIRFVFASGDHQNAPGFQNGTDSHSDCQFRLKFIGTKEAGVILHGLLGQSLQPGT